MLRNYLTIALRNLLRHQIFSLINIGGLAVGMACSLLIILYVADELSYDQFHVHHRRIFRIASKHIHSGTTFESDAGTHFALAPLLKNDFTFIEKAVRLQNATETIRYGTVRYQEKKVVYADSTFFDVFSYVFIQGDPRTALKEPNTAVITQAIATKYFGQENPLGKMLDLKNDLIKITGVIEEMPRNSHFHFDLVISMPTAAKHYEDHMYHFYAGTTHYTYLLLSQPSDAEKFQAQFPAFCQKHLGDKSKLHCFLQPLADIHLHSNIAGELEANGSSTNLYIFSAVALIILLIACINYMNLTTARSIGRAREVGLRKVVGANRRQLIVQFLGESFLVSTLALVLASGLAYLTMPFFNELAGKQLALHFLADWKLLLSLVAFALGIGLLAGSYPAFLLSGFQLAQVIKGKVSRASREGLGLRKGLVVFQFSISITLITATLLVYRQLDYLRNKNLGINPHQLLAIPLQGLETQYATLRTAVLQNPRVEAVGVVSNDLISGGTNWSQYIVEGAPATEEVNIGTMVIDHDFLSTVQARVIAGRGFSKAFPTDAADAYLINEAAARLLQLEKPVGRLLSGNLFVMENGNFKRIRKHGRIIGVVKDFHFASLHSEIKPIVFNLSSDQSYLPDMMQVRISGQDIPRTIAFLKETWQKFDSDNPLQYTFMDEELDRLYRAEERFLKVFTTFSCLAIMIACLGILGLALLTTTQRTKEIGIRKVLGASVGNIVTLLSRDFVKLVLLANVIAWPLAYYAMSQWLEGFAYRIGLSWWVFALAGITALLIAMLTVSYQAVKAAVANPVESLRAE